MTDDSDVKDVKKALTQAFIDEAGGVADRLRRAADAVERKAQVLPNHRDQILDHNQTASTILHEVTSSLAGLGLTGLLARAADADRYYRDHKETP